MSRRTTITTLGTVAAGSTIGATPESWESYTLDGRSPQSIWYSFVAPVDGDVFVTLQGSSFDTALFLFEVSPADGSPVPVSVAAH